MINWLKKQNIVVLIVLFTLLPVLAVLQYYWLGQLSEGEKARMQSNLKISAERFAEDFDFELSKIYSGFSNLGFESYSDSVVIKNALKETRNILTFPQIIKNVFMVSPGENNLPDIFEYLENKGNFLKINWPSRFNTIYKQIGFDKNFPLGALIALSHRPNLADPPVIIINTGPVSQKLWSNQVVINFLMIELSKEVITQDFLSMLAEKYFSLDNELLYDMSIIKKDSVSTLFYSSSNESGDEFMQSSETSIEIGNWRLDRFLIAATKVVLKDSIKNQPMSKKIKIRDERQISVEIINQDSIVEEESFQFTIAKSVPWRLYLKHKAGNLDSIVQNARTRNLVLSYIILLLLGLSIGFVYSNARKTQKTAIQQIEFVAGLTHELRTPLATIRSAAENIKDGVVKDDPRIREYGELIYKEDVRLTRMIEQTLYFSGISFGGQKIIKEKIDVTKIIRKNLEQFTGENIQTDISTIPDIEADADSIKILFGNLISNAIKYSNPGGLVKIKGALTADRQQVEFQIIDQGKGIAKEDLANIFNLFYRTNEAKQNQVRGSGIGLSLVKKIVEAHQGHISVKSEVGKGSTFIVTLPV